MAQEEAPLDVTSIYRAAIRLARYRTARERLSYPSGARAATGWYRELMGEKFPPPIAGMERATAVDVHQMRTGRWSGSAQFLHEIGRNPSPVCPQCRDTKCEAARCPLCVKEADTPPWWPPWWPPSGLSRANRLRRRVPRDRRDNQQQQQLTEPRAQTFQKSKTIVGIIFYTLPSSFSSQNSM